jgi:pimeloyl-ACP methyl ester carboxylesterase
VEAAVTEHIVTHHTLSVKDVRLHYMTAGAGDPVVLLHGWPETCAMWDSILPTLAARYTVIAPDLRGLGASSKPAGGYDMDNVADDIYQLVRELGHARILLAGHDWGAAAAYSYAAQHPEDVRRLAIFEMVLPGFGIMEGAMAPRPNGEFLWHMGFQSVPDLPQALIADREDIYLGHIFRQYAYDPSAVAPDRMRHYVEAMRAVGALRAGLGYYEAYFTSAAQNERHAQSKLEMPVLAMAGEACLGPLTQQCLELAASDVRGGVISQCGHWIGEERPDYVADQLLSFFGEDAATPQ